MRIVQRKRRPTSNVDSMTVLRYCRGAKAVDTSTPSCAPISNGRTRRLAVNCETSTRPGRRGEQHQGADQRLVIDYLSVASVTWYGAQHNTTSPDEGVWRCFAILWSDHSMQERFTGVQAAAVLGNHSQAALERLGREPGEVRRHDESGQLEQRVVRVHRFA
jgi:hypothetical protein